MHTKIAQTAQTKPLIRWMDEGDPDLMPVLMGDARSTTASYYGVSSRTEGTSASFTGRESSPVTPEMIVECSRELGVHFHVNLGSVTPFDVVELMNDVEVTVREEQVPGEGIRKLTTVRTPAGEMSDIFVTPPAMPGYWLEHLIKTDDDLPALTYLIEESARVCREDGRVREKVTGKLKSEADRWPAEVPLYATIGIPAFVLSCNLFIEPTSALYMMADHAALLERLYEAYEECSQVWVECAAAAGADFVLGAINGLELFSPDTFTRHFVPQAARLHTWAHNLGMRGWVHTCGLMDRLIDSGVYHEMKVDVLESLSSPPLGDLDDLRTARAKLGSGMVTRGAVNVDLFYADDLDAIRARTRQVLEETRGYRHMIGDTNDSFPPYPRENILAMVDEVRKSGRLTPGP